MGRFTTVETDRERGKAGKKVIFIAQTKEFGCVFPSKCSVCALCRFFFSHSSLLNVNLLTETGVLIGFAFNPPSKRLLKDAHHFGANDYEIHSDKK